MSRILCAWELGSGAGHVEPLARVLAALAARGHELVMAARSLPAARRALAGLPVRLLQSPVWLERNPHRATAASYPELLEQVGYAQPAGVTALVSAWREILALVEPEVVLAEHSPGALLAARMEGVPAVVVGTGFTLPPLSAPMATLLPGTPVSPRRLARSEQAVLARLNGVLTAAGATPLESCAELLAGRARVLWTLPELDHYQHREGDTYTGPLIATPGDAPSWPPGEAPRVFAYYHARYDAFPVVVAALQALRRPAVLVAGGAREDDLSGHRRPWLEVTATHVDLRRASSEAALVLSHGGFGTVATCLLSGCPVAVMAHFVEQQMLAFRIRERGLADLLPPSSPAAAVAARLGALLADEELRRRVATLAARHTGLDDTLPVTRTVAALETALAGAGRADS